MTKDPPEPIAIELFGIRVERVDHFCARFLNQDERFLHTIPTQTKRVRSDFGRAL